MQYLIIGNPRSGSGYAAYLFNSLGLKAIHETTTASKLDEHTALSSRAYAITDQPKGELPMFGRPPRDHQGPWLCAPNAADSAAREKFSHFDESIVNLRNPVDAIPALVDENRSRWSRRLRFNAIERAFGFSIAGNELEQGILAYIYFNRLALSNADFHFRIEHDYLKLRSFLGARHADLKGLTEDQINQKVNGKRRTVVVSNRHWKAVSNQTKSALKHFCEEYQYDFEPSKLLTSGPDLVRLTATGATRRLKAMTRPRQL